MMVYFMLVACDAASSGSDRRPTPPVRDDTASGGCAAGEILDGDACVPEDCGTGTWGDLALDASAVYVDGGAASGGDGSADRPFRTVQDGADAAAERRGTVVVAAGTYAENVTLGDDHDGVQIVGRCSALVTVDGSPDGALSTFLVKGQGRPPTVDLAGLTVTGGNIGVYYDNAAGSLADLAVADNVAMGVCAVDAATVTLDGVAITGTVPDPDLGEGYGLGAAYAASVLARDCTIDGNTTIGVLAYDATAIIALEDTTVSNTAPEGRSLVGYGAYAGEGATITAVRSRFEGNTGAAVYSDADALVAIEDSTLTATTGYGILASTGTVTASASTITGNQGYGVVLDGEGSSVVLEDTLVAGTLPDQEWGDGYGLAIDKGTSLTANRCRIDGNSGVGVIVNGVDAYVELVDTSITGTMRIGDKGFASALVAQMEAVASCTNVTIDGTDGPGFYSVAGPITCTGCSITNGTFAGALAMTGSVTLASTYVGPVAPDPEFGGGFGAFATNWEGPATLVVTDSTIEQQPYAAIWLDGTGTYDIERNDLAGGPGADQNGNLVAGNALFAQGGIGEWSGVDGLLIADNAFSGSDQVAVFLDGATATLHANTWADNALDLLQQRCDGITPLDAAAVAGVPGVSICPVGNRLTAYDLDYDSLVLSTAETGS